MSDDRVEQYRTICRCGHDKSTHFSGKGMCLGMRCDDCKRYVNEWDKTGANNKVALEVKTEGPPPPPSSRPTTDWEYDTYDDDDDYSPGSCP